MIVSSVNLADCKQRDFTISQDLVKKSVRYHQETVGACKLVHVVCYANPNPTESGLHCLIPVTWFFGSFGFLGLAPRL